MARCRMSREREIRSPKAEIRKKAESRRLHGPGPWREAFGVRRIPALSLSRRAQLSHSAGIRRTPNASRGSVATVAHWIR